jgi:hypothetical protein
MKISLEPGQASRLFYPDAIRALAIGRHRVPACFFSHCTGFLRISARLVVDRECGLFLRTAPAIALFVMISGGQSA